MTPIATKAYRCSRSRLVSGAYDISFAVDACVNVLALPDKEQYYKVIRSALGDLR